MASVIEDFAWHCKLMTYNMSILLVFCIHFLCAICGLRRPDMADAAHITYLFDPLCGWCYGASPTLEGLAARPDFIIKLAPTGLFAGEGARPMDDGFAAYAWANDQRIARLTSQTFSEDYRRKVLS